MEIISIAAAAAGSLALAVAMSYVAMRQSMKTMLVAVRRSRRR